MLREHEIGRALRHRMGEAFHGRDLERLLVASLDFCELLTQHIAKENDILYPMAEQGIPDDERLPIQEAYAAAARHLGAGALRVRFERERDALRAMLG
jgi:hemerythrin-like domain-containing protein